MIARAVCCALVCLGLVAAGPVGAAELTYRTQTGAETGQQPAVTVGARAVVTMRDVHDALSIFYYETAMEMHRRQTAWARWFAGEQLLAARAQARNLSIAELVRAETAPAPATAEEWEAARRRYVDRLWREANAALKVREPERPQVVVSESSTGPVIGGFQGDAPVSVVAFCSFTSAECREGWQTLRQLVQHLGAELRIAHRDFAPADEPAARTAAVAARCAHRQGKFWDYQDRLYGAQPLSADLATLGAYARDLALDVTVFDRCLHQRETEQEIEWDLWEARRVGIIRVPALFVNATYVSEVLSFSDMLGLLRSLAIGGGPGSRLR